MSQYSRDFLEAEREHLNEPEHRETEAEADRDDRICHERRDEWTDADYAQAAEYERRREAGEFNTGDQRC